MKIVADKFVLRPWCEEDAESLAKRANNIEIWRNLRDGFPHPYTLEDAKRFIGSVGSLPSVFAIEIDGEAVGSIGYFPQTATERHCAEVGYWLAEEYWGRGIMNAAVRVLSEYIFKNTEILRLFATPYGHNAASMRVLEKAGYTKVGLMRKAEMKNGIPVDKWYFELVK